MGGWCAGVCVCVCVHSLHWAKLRLAGSIMIHITATQTEPNASAKVWCIINFENLATTEVTIAT